MISKRKVKIERLAYSLKEVAQMLGVSQGHLRHEHKRGKLKFSKSSDRTLILATDLRRYLAELPDSVVPFEAPSGKHY